jgi:acyl-CoA thioesterase-2
MEQGSFGNDISASGFSASWDRIDIAALLDLKTVAGDRYRSHYNDANFNGEIFGGQFLGQAMMAALRSGDGRRPQSMHGYFLQAGDSTRPLEITVERVRDGRSFQHRRVVMEQGGKPCFVADVALHDPEAGTLSHRQPMPDAPRPATLSTLHEIADRHAAELGPTAVARILRKISIELRPVDPLSGVVKKAESLSACCWVRAAQLLNSDDPQLHCSLLAYLSDCWSNIAARNPHSSNVFDASIGASSINQSLWFHEPGRGDGWMLFDTDSPAAFGGTGLTRGSIYAEDGRLLASFAQEALMRRGGS